MDDMPLLNSTEENQGILHYIHISFLPGILKGEVLLGRTVAVGWKLKIKTKLNRLLGPGEIWGRRGVV